MDSSIHHINRINATESLTIGRFQQLCSDIFYKATKSVVGIHKRARFAVNLKILNLAKFDVLLGQPAVTACDIELMSALPNGYINFEETMLGYDRQQKESALNTSQNDIYKIRHDISLYSSKLCKSELDLICSLLNSTVRRIGCLDHLQSFPEPKISYSDLLRMFCQNLSRAFSHNQNHLTAHCFHQPEDHVLAENHCHNMCASCPADETMGITANSTNTFSSRFSQDHSERNTDRFMQSKTAKIHAGLEFSGMKAECTKTESLTTDGVYSDSLSYDFHTTTADESGKVTVTQNSRYLDKNMSDFDPLSINDAMTSMTDSSSQLASCLSHKQSTATCDKKTSRCRRRHRQLHSVQQYIGWRSHKLCRKQNHRLSKSRANLPHMSLSRPPIQVADGHHLSVRSDNNCNGGKYFMEADTPIKQKEKDFDMNLKFSDLAKDVNCAEGRHACFEIINYETDDDDDHLTDGTCCIVIDDKETDDEVTDDEEETDEFVFAADESNSANIWDGEITDEKTDEEEEQRLNGKAAVFACNRSNKANETSAGTFCKSSFFISPSEVDSSSDSDDEDDEDNDLEVDGWDGSEDQSSDTLFSGICESFSFNGLYFPSSCSTVEAKLSLEELKENDRTRLLSASGSPSALTLDCSGSDNSCDDIVFCDDQELLSCASEDEEDVPLKNLSHLQSINARWNHFYSEVEKPTQNKKQVRFARDSSLVTIYGEALSEAEDYAAARKGSWEEYARDRDRFTRRIRDAAEQLSWVLSPIHRSEVYRNSFSKC